MHPSRSAARRSRRERFTTSARICQMLRNCPFVRTDSIVIPSGGRAVSASAMNATQASSRHTDQCGCEPALGACGSAESSLARRNPSLGVAGRPSTGGRDGHQPHRDHHDQVLGERPRGEEEHGGRKDESDLPDSMEVHAVGSEKRNEARKCSVGVVREVASTDVEERGRIDESLPERNCMLEQRAENSRQPCAGSIAMNGELTKRAFPTVRAGSGRQRRPPPALRARST